MVVSGPIGPVGMAMVTLLLRGLAYADHLHVEGEGLTGERVVGVYMNIRGIDVDHPDGHGVAGAHLAAVLTALSDVR